MGRQAGLTVTLLTSGRSWRWIFLAKVPAVALVLLAAVRAVPPTRRRTRGRYDLAGAVTGTGGAVLLTYGVTRAAAADASTADITLPIVGAVALLAVFVLVARRGRAPRGPVDASGITRPANSLPCFTMGVELKQLRYFVAVAEELNFSAAAPAASTSPSRH